MKNVLALVFVGLIGGCGGGGGGGGGSDAGVADGSASGGTGGSASGGTGGSASGGTGGSAGPLTKADCTDFPVTIPGGETIVPATVGAVLCDPETKFCRVDNNTYSEACGGEQEIFVSIGGTPALGTVYLRNQSDWKLVDFTHGIDTGTQTYSVRNLPLDTEITLGVSKAGTTYNLVFELRGTNIRFISFRPRT